jgi:hypothetical protein
MRSIGRIVDVFGDWRVWMRTIGPFPANPSLIDCMFQPGSGPSQLAISCHPSTFCIEFGQGQVIKMKVKRCIAIICNAGVIALSLMGGTALSLGARELKSESLSTADLQDAQESIAVGSSKLRLTAYLWRDFMPMALANDSAAARAALAAARGVMASVKLVDENGKPLPKSLHAEVVCVVQGGHIWQTSAIEETRDESNPSTLTFVIRKGPQWEPRSFVDVFVRIKEGNGVPLLLVAHHQIINAAV